MEMVWRSLPRKIREILSEEELEKLVDQYEKKIAVLDEPVVMLQGEYVFTYRLVERLKEAGILVLASCTEPDSLSANPLQ